MTDWDDVNYNRERRIRDDTKTSVEQVHVDRLHSTYKTHTHTNT